MFRANSLLRMSKNVTNLENLEKNYNQFSCLEQCVGRCTSNVWCCLWMYIGND